MTRFISLMFIFYDRFKIKSSKKENSMNGKMNLSDCILKIILLILKFKIFFNLNKFYVQNFTEKTLMNKVLIVK